MLGCWWMTGSQWSSGGNMATAYPCQSHSPRIGIADQAGLKKNLEARRAKFLETKLESLVAAVLPNFPATQNPKWCWEGKEYETDLLVTVDRTVLIFEAKSAGLSPQALRGAPDRVKRHIEDIVVEPAQQSSRLEQVIWLAKKGNATAIKALVDLEIDAASVDTIVRVSVTLDDFSVLSSAEGELKQAGWVPDDLSLAPTINIADLGCIADILREPIYFIHYLLERGRVQKCIEVLGDELDFLGLYLATGFNLHRIEAAGDALAITGMSKPVDMFYANQEAGVPSARPIPRLNHYFAALIGELQRRAPPAWTTMALDILRAASFEEQDEIVKALERLRRDVPLQYRDPKHSCSIVVVPPSGREANLLIYVYPRELSSRRADAVSELVAKALAESDRSRCVFVGRMIEEWDKPYRFVGIATAATED
jgi:hypothetical protein